MGLKERIEEDAQNVFLNSLEFAENVTYQPAGGSGKAISAIVRIERDEPENQADGAVRIREATLVISTDSTSGIPNPSEADRVTISNEVWEVIGISYQAIGLAALRIARIEPLERAGEDHRLRRL